LCHQSIPNVGASHNAVANLLELIEQFVDHIETYTKVTFERAMVELTVKMMATPARPWFGDQRDQTETIE
jgi:hypothetical protein